MNIIGFGYLIMIWTTDIHFKIFMVVGIQIMFFWIMTLCHLIGGNQHFGGTCSLSFGSEQHVNSKDRGRMFLQCWYGVWEHMVSQSKSYMFCIFDSLQMSSSSHALGINACCTYGWLIEISDTHSCCIHFKGHWELINNVEKRTHILWKSYIKFLLGH
jgi:hypothetical protein